MLAAVVGIDTAIRRSLPPAAGISVNDGTNTGSSIGGGGSASTATGGGGSGSSGDDVAIDSEVDWEEAMYAP